MATDAGADRVKGASRWCLRHVTVSPFLLITQPTNQQNLTVSH